MSRSRVFALSAAAAAAALFAMSSAHATVDLIAIGQLSGTSLDRSKETAGKLENGAPGNLLGGPRIGHGLRGMPHVSRSSGPRPERHRLSTRPSTTRPPTSTASRRCACACEASRARCALPYTLTPKLLDTTLLASVGQSACMERARRPACRTARRSSTGENHTSYFTGRSDNFDPAHSSTYARDARFDPESIRVSSDGDSVFISDEYGPYVYRFDRKMGREIDVLKVPDTFAGDEALPIGDDEISENTMGRVANKGMEGLAISPDGKTLFGAMQSPLIQDGGRRRRRTRAILKIDVRAARRRNTPTRSPTSARRRSRNTRPSATWSPSTSMNCSSTSATARVSATIRRRRSRRCSISTSPARRT